MKAFIPPCNQPEPQVLLKIFRKPASALPQYGLLQENAPRINPTNFRHFYLRGAPARKSGGRQLAIEEKSKKNACKSHAERLDENFKNQATGV